MPETDHLSLPTELGPGKRRYSVLLLVSVCFMVTGMLIVPEMPAVGYTCVGLFALCAMAFLLALMYSIPRLVLMAEGFRVQGAFGKAKTVYWRDTAGFAPFKMGLVRSVAWQPANPPAGGGLKEAAREKLLPDSFGLRPEELARLMNKLREDAVAGDAS